jgi:hypothetical protein
LVAAARDADERALEWDIDWHNSQVVFRRSSTRGAGCGADSRARKPVRRGRHLAKTVARIKTVSSTGS